MRRAIYDALLEHGPGDFQALRQRLRESGAEADLQHRTASHHLVKLCKVGAIASGWVDGRKVFEANLDPATVRAEQYLRYLHQHGAVDLVRDMAGSEMDRDAVLAYLKRRQGSRQRASRVLRDLVAVAILEPAARPNLYRLTPPLQTIASTIGTKP